MQPDIHSLTKSELRLAFISLQAHNNELQARNDELLGKCEKLETDNLYFQQQLDQLKRMIFGASSERFVSNVSDKQLVLDFGEEPEIVEPEPQKEQITYERNKGRRRPEGTDRQQVPDHLPRKEVVIEPEQDVTGWECIGYEESKQLAYEPGSLYVQVTKRPKYVNPEDPEAGVAIAAMPSQPLPKSYAHSSLLALIIVDKFMDSIPLYRQMKRLQREGVRIPESTLSDWVQQCARLLKPLYEALRRELVTCGYIKGDETTIPVMHEKGSGKGKTHLGYLWGFMAPLSRLIVFEYQKGRGRDGPRPLLSQMHGYLQTDGYQVYKTLIKELKDCGITTLTLAGCMAHVRRYFKNAYDAGDVRAEGMLKLIQKLYLIERHAKENNLTAEAIQRLRQDKAVPVLEEMRRCVNEIAPQATKKSLMGKAITYISHRWEEITVYTTDGRIEIDNNSLENQIRTLAIGRKNFLFAGSHDAAQNLAIIYSLLATCRLNDVAPLTWLTETLEKLPDWPVNRIHELLPHYQAKAAQQEAMAEAA